MKERVALTALIALASATPVFAETPIAPATADWTHDAPGVRHRITLDDLPAPYATKSVQNDARVVRRPSSGQPRVPPGFKIEEYASGFVYPRFLLTAPNGDIYITESRSDSVKVLRDSDGNGKPDTTEIFADRDMNNPFGIAFYPPGPEPQFLYVANTNSVVRFPYHNGDIKARGPAEKLSAELSAGGLLHGGGPSGIGADEMPHLVASAYSVPVLSSTYCAWVGAIQIAAHQPAAFCTAAISEFANGVGFRSQRGLLLGRSIRRPA